MSTVNKTQSPRDWRLCDDEVEPGEALNVGELVYKK